MSHKALCDFSTNYGKGCTGTFIHFVEKSGFVNKTIPNLKESIIGGEDDDNYHKRFHLETSHFFR